MAARERADASEPWSARMESMPMQIMSLCRRVLPHESGVRAASVEEARP